MSEAKFTKGPWAARGSIPSRIYGMQRKDKEVIVAATGSVLDNAKANAHLIAAAPEMYDMLNLIFNSCHSNADGTADVDIIKLKELLSKARGEK